MFHSYFPTSSISLWHHRSMSADATAWIVEKACETGFDLCGVAPVADFAELDRLPEWLNRGYAGEMKYLHDPRRQNPLRLLEGARSLIVVALNYNTRHPHSTQVSLNGNARGWISRYAWGDDYHSIIGDKLESLVSAIRAHFPDTCSVRAYVDTGPIIERIAAKYAGLGWLAKNTCLINQKLGSWLFLGVIVTSLELKPTIPADDALPPDLCGTCRRCIDACPTQAIVEPYVLDARRCISYLTIELRGAIPEEFRPAMTNHVFGCDICQDVCPWNRKSPVTELINFQPRKRTAANDTKNSGVKNNEAKNTNGDPAGAEKYSLCAPDLEWLASLTEDDFRAFFKGSPVKRTKWRGLIRNICVALGNSKMASDSAGYARITRTLEALAASPDSLIAEHAQWALDQLGPLASSAPPNARSN